MVVMLAHVFSIPLFVGTFCFLCAIPPMWPIVSGYIIWAIFLDKRPAGGMMLTRFQRACRQMWWWKLFADYFPVEVHKTVDLEPCFIAAKLGEQTSELASRKPRYWFIRWFYWWIKCLFWWAYVLKNFVSESNDKDKFLPTGKRYLFGYHPHGIIAMGALAAIGTDGAAWSRKFPGIPTRLLTVANNFYLPIHREYLLSVGIGSVSKESCLNFLRNNQPICIVLGGARESLLGKPGGDMSLVLNRRRGFVKVALATGASLVPVIAFGETEIYNQLQYDKSTWSGYFHDFMVHNFGFTVPIFWARGIFNLDWGILPYRRPIHVVVGEPIDVPLLGGKVTDNCIDHYHDLYKENLRNLWEENKTRYGGRSFSIVA